MRYDIEKIRSLSEQTLIGCHLSKEEAALVVDSMLEADINGVSTHGIRMLYAYVDKLKNGQFAIA